ncbi:MAG: transcription antitermination factor NusB [Bacteroidia bacterium]|nr:transcription antitermination factor NusB [Bacteroidia bacterium]MBT8278251.1 transcription antitermination factor NusB [Bacteroidia bacterium]NND24576.1 transcription antitermination factor NusB [Flavobacteriaceae bacterium]NNK59091.1 transcription antitermination factor NusB [Flavobacteriaceae bacterium]NNL31677.1 transcription antitermination factor NusB [Flavobacteriaceae bacterium]
MQILYGFKGSESDDIKVLERTLIRSMEEMYDLYLLIMSLLIEVQKRAELHLSSSKNKHLATKEDINPNYKFVNNAVLAQIIQNKDLADELKSRKINNWEMDGEYVDVIFKALIKSDLYKRNMENTDDSYKADKAFLLDVFKNIVAPNDKLYDYLEDKNLTWIDDLPVVNTIIVKLIKKLEPDAPSKSILPNLYKDEEDKSFGIELLTKTILNLTSLNKIISEKTQNWDKDRIANVDLVLLQLAIIEFQKFPSIPVKVTINEYLEIAKEYSTPKSSVFINGILDKLIKEYEAKGTLNKAGRGLM